MTRARAYIGTSGWNYSDWRGRFYPNRLRQADWLGHFAGHFDSVEVNNVFYHLPVRKHVANWARQVPSRFRFAVKMWRGVSHYKKLKDCRAHLETYFAAVTALPRRQRGPVLVQLPSNQGNDADKLDAFLDDLWAVTRGDRWKIVLEFRNRQWLCSEIYKLLDRRRVAICLHDMPPAEVTRPNNASFVYLRRHGPTGNYGGSYDDTAIERDAENIKVWLAEGRTVFIYYNNDNQAHAVFDAQRLQAAVGETP